MYRLPRSIVVCGNGFPPLANESSFRPREEAQWPTEQSPLRCVGARHVTAAIGLILASDRLLQGHVRFCFLRLGQVARQRNGVIIVGTAGWTYDGWRGPFYPPSIPKTQWLLHYAGVFDSTEINGSLYSTPSLSAVERWRE